MFCPHCGKQVISEGSFCTYCGSAFNSIEQVQPQSYHQGYQRNVQRQQEISEMERMINYFSQKAMQYNEYDLVSAQLYKLKKSNKYPLIVWGCILLSLGIYNIIRMIITLATNNFDMQGYSYIENVVVGGLYSSFIIPGIILIISFITQFKKHNIKLVECLKRYEELSEELYVHYISYQNCPIGPQYTNPSNLQAIYQTIISGRADTTKEALNVLVEDAHRRKMEDLAVVTAQYAQQAAQATAKTASYARAGAFFTAANFFLK